MNHSGINDALKKFKELDRLKDGYEKEMGRVDEARRNAVRAFHYKTYDTEGTCLSERRYLNIVFQLERVCREQELDIKKKYEDLISKI